MRQSRLRRFLRLHFLNAIRLAPGPWSLKWRLIWLAAPKVVLGVAALIEDENGRVLVLLSRHRCRWQLPGGTVNAGEQVERAVRREVREELGLELETSRLVGVFPDRAAMSQSVLFRSELAPGPIVLSEEHTEYRFVKFDD